MQPICIIPARMNSKRFYGKPLAKINGKEMVIRVADICKKAVGENRVIITTPDIQIAKCAVYYGYNVVFSSISHPNGNVRCANVAKNLGIDYYINVQGDEPTIYTEHIEKVISYLKHCKENECVMLKAKIKNLILIRDINVPKIEIQKGADDVVVNCYRNYNKNKFDSTTNYKQIPLFGYKKIPLCYLKNAPSKLENKTSMCLGRMIDCGYKVNTITVKDTQAVDLPIHIKIVEKILKAQGRI